MNNIDFTEKLSEILNFIWRPKYLFFLILLLFARPAEEVNAQTVYKQEKGLFTGLPTFHLQSGQLQSFQLIGPWAGYRFNENLDLRVHVEYVTSERKIISDEFSLYNMGVTGGYTHHMPKLKWRTSVRIYRVFNVKSGPEARFSPEGFSTAANSGLYVPVKLSNRITMLPFVNLFAGTGKARIPNGTLSGHSDGFAAGTSLGLNFNMTFSALTFTIGSGYAFEFYGNKDDSGVILTLAFNF